MSDELNAARFEITPLSLAGVSVIRRRRTDDARGWFSRLFCADALAAAGWTWPVSQINQSSTSKAGTVRGLHYQRPPHTEAKLVICLRGRAWDVALDLRSGSPSFLRWCAREISAEEGTALLIPPGCAHGFQALSDDVELLYLHSVPYVSSHDAGVNPLDPRVAISWPMPIALMSRKDATRPFLDIDFPGLQP